MQCAWITLKALEEPVLPNLGVIAYSAAFNARHSLDSMILWVIQPKKYIYSQKI